MREELLDAVEDVATYVQLGKKELSASQLAERLGFSAKRQRTPVGDLSGGERRRLQLTRVLLAEPNVLLLDEPTNDLDIDTLQELESLLDSWPGTMVVISHDRYLIERIADSTYALFGDGKLTNLPGGIVDPGEEPAVAAAREALVAAGVTRLVVAGGETSGAVVGALVFVVGAALAAWKLAADTSIWVFVAGMVLMLFGTISATPVLARPVVRAIAAVARPRSGIVAQLAAENSLRNPRRTATSLPSSEIAPPIALPA